MNLKNPKLKASLASLLSVMIFFILGATLVFGQGTGNNPGQGGGSNGFNLDNPFNCGGADPNHCTLFDLLTALVTNIIMPIGAVLAVLAFIYTGFLFVTAQGDASQLKTAKNALINTSIGTAILLGAWSIAEVIKNTVNQLIAN